MGQHPPRWRHAVWPRSCCFNPAKVPERVHRETLVQQLRGAQCRPGQHEELSVNHRWRWAAKQRHHFIWLSHLECNVSTVWQKWLLFLHQLLNSHQFGFSFHAQYFYSFTFQMENPLSSHTLDKTVNIRHCQCSITNLPQFISLRRIKDARQKVKPLKIATFHSNLVKFSPIKPDYHSCISGNSLKLKFCTQPTFFLNTNNEGFCLKCMKEGINFSDDLYFILWLFGSGF